MREEKRCCGCPLVQFPERNKSYVLQFPPGLFHALGRWALWLAPVFVYKDTQLSQTPWLSMNKYRNASLLRGG